MDQVHTVNNVKTFADMKTHFIVQIACGGVPPAPEHSHGFFELIFVLAGECGHLANGRPASMHSRDFLMLYPGDTHCFLDKSEDAQILCISISAAEFQRYEILFPDALASSGTERVPCTLPEAAARAVRALMGPFPDITDHYARMICACLLGAWADLAGTVARELPEPLQRMLNQMAREPLLLAEGVPAMQRLSNYSLSQLSRLMKQYFDTTPHACLKELRLRAAWRMLMESSLSAEAVAQECGYACYGYFTGIFKEKYGITPAVLRKTRN